MSDRQTETKDLQHDRVDRECKLLDSPGHFTGYANVTGYRDAGGDIVHPGAFAATIKTRGGKVPLMLMHDPTCDIGVATIEEDARGLKVTDGAINLECEGGREIYSKMKMYLDAGMRTEMSIGYRAVKWDWTEDPKLGSTRNLREVQLLEISLLPPGYAMNDRSTVRTVKATDDEAASQIKTLTDRIAALEARLTEKTTPTADPQATQSADDSGKAGDPQTQSSTADPAELKKLAGQLDALMEVLSGRSARDSEQDGRGGHGDQGVAQAS